MRLQAGAALLLAGSLAGYSQATGTATSTARSTGTCSPAISGSNNNQITISCTAVSREKANEMIRLMNRILKEQIDPELVYRRLGELQGDVGRIDAAVNPLSHVPAAEAKLVRESDPLLQSCADRMSSWMKANEEAYQQAMQAARAARRAQMDASMEAARKGQPYERTPVPDLGALRQKALEGIAPQQAAAFEEGAGVAVRRWMGEVRRAEPTLTTTPLPGTVQRFEDAQATCEAMSRMYMALHRAVRDEAQGQQ